MIVLISSRLELSQYIECVLVTPKQQTESPRFPHLRLSYLVAAAACLYPPHVVLIWPSSHRCHCRHHHCHYHLPFPLQSLPISPLFLDGSLAQPKTSQPTLLSGLGFLQARWSAARQQVVCWVLSITSSLPIHRLVATATDLNILRNSSNGWHTKSFSSCG